MSFLYLVLLNRLTPHGAPICLIDMASPNRKAQKRNENMHISLCLMLIDRFNIIRSFSSPVVIWSPSNYILGIIIFVTSTAKLEFIGAVPDLSQYHKPSGSTNLTGLPAQYR